LIPDIGKLVIQAMYSSCFMVVAVILNYGNTFELAKHHRVYAFDMVGAGRSDKPSAA
jgi:pimeloyl-ACP methyl ester carboxylesterase